MSTNLVAHAMNRFIPRFFSCLYCAFHFAANSANIALPGETILPRNRPPPSPSNFVWDPSILKVLPPAPKNAEQEVLWLNAVHNRVNKRLSGSPSEDPMALKLPYPSAAVCPACWANDRSGVVVPGTTSSTRESLLRFLVAHYRSSSWQSDNVPRTVFTHTEGLVLERSNVDLITISVISVLLTAVVMIILLVLFRSLWRCNSKKRRI